MEGEGGTVTGEGVSGYTVKVEKKREKQKQKKKKGKSKYARWGPEIPGRSTLTPGIYLDLKRHTLI